MILHEELYGFSKQGKINLNLKLNTNTIMVVKYRIREYNPAESQMGSHSWYAETIITNEINNQDLAELVAARTGYKSYECQSVIAAIGDIIKTQMLMSNRVTLSNEKGVKIVSLYPKVSGSVSDLDIERITTAQHAADPSVPIRTKAEASDLTADKLQWAVGATVGVKLSKQFAIDKQARRVKDNGQAVGVGSEEEVVDESDGGDNGGNNGGGGTLVDDGE